MRSIETLDVSRPRPSTRAQRAGSVASDVLLAVLVVLVLPLGLTLAFSPIVLLVRFVLGLAGLL